MAVWDRLLRDCGEIGQAELMGALTACRLRPGASGTVLIEVPDHRDCRMLLDDPQTYVPLIQAAVSVHAGAISISLVPAPGVAPRGRYRRAEQDPAVLWFKEHCEAEVLICEPMSEAEWNAQLNPETPPSA